MADQLDLAAIRQRHRNTSPHIKERQTWKDMAALLAALDAVTAERDRLRKELNDWRRASLVETRGSDWPRITPMPSSAAPVAVAAELAGRDSLAAGIDWMARSGELPELQQHRKITDEWVAKLGYLVAHGKTPVEALSEFARIYAPSSAAPVAGAGEKPGEQP